MSAAEPLSLLFYGACSVQSLLADCAREGEAAGLALRAEATHFGDLARCAELAPAAIVVGHFAQKNNMFEYPPWPDGRAGADAYGRVLGRFLAAVRERSAAPLFVLNVPTPTVSPFGLSDQGPDSHVNRARQLNLELARVTAEHRDAFVLDVDAVLGLHGRLGRVDDVIAGFGHLGTLGGLLERFAQPLVGLERYSDPFAQVPAELQPQPSGERLLARELVRMLRVVRGHARKKCVVVDLDGTLWPSVLADTGEPFAGQPSFDTYPYAAFWGLHSALKALQARGILLCCVSKNDEAVVRKLMRYQGVPDGFFLTLDDFASYRINWDEKVDNIRALARELNIGVDSLVFIDDNPIERAKVERYLPEVWVLGGEPLRVRHALLTDPRLDVAARTEEAQRRHDMTRGQLARDRERDALDPGEFLAGLQMELTVERVRPGDPLERVHELVQRTNQLNTTGKRFERSELAALVADADARVLQLQAKDRFVDYGTVGVAITQGNCVELFLLSCRVLGLGVEPNVLDAAIRELEVRFAEVHGRFVATDRNQPARNLFRDQGFHRREDGVYSLRLADYSPTLPDCHAVVNRVHC
jgi:FkbH-like protein